MTSSSMNGRKASDGSKEWVELLVVNGPVDMRGWDLGDSQPAT